MSQNSRVPADRAALDELSGSLRQAVEQVRAVPLPEKIMGRCLDQARRLGSMPGAPRQRRKSILALAALAATLLVGVVLPPRPSARNDKGALALRLLGYASFDVDAQKSRSRAMVYDGLEGTVAGFKGQIRVKGISDGTSNTVEFDKRKKAILDAMMEVDRRIEVKKAKVLLPPLGEGKALEEASKIGGERGKGPAETPDRTSDPLRGGRGIRHFRSPVEADALETVGAIIIRANTPADLESTIQEIKEKQRLEHRGSPDKKSAKGPHVWHRERQQPTFARVYVGDGNSLELVSLHVTVTVEGARARTVVDHIFRNPHDRQLEGTFEYPLPAGASPSYFAMFLGQTRATVPPRFARRGNTPPLPEDTLAHLTPSQLVKHVDTSDWGKLQEAHIVSQEKGREIYEAVVRSQIDPALLEYAGGNTFRGRVFPIAPKGYNRVLLAYEELLPCTGDKALYRFPLPGRKLTEMQFSLNANAAECKEPAMLPKDARKETDGKRLTYARTWKGQKPQGEIIFAFKPAQPDVQASSGRQGDNGPVYLYARIRPELKEVEQAKPFADHAVFLLDTSLSEYPYRFDVSMQLLRKILETDQAIKHFNILTFDVGSAWVEPKGWLPNTKDGREKAWKRLDGILLEGATDLGAALDKLALPGFVIPATTAVNVFLLSDGQSTWGEADAASLAARFESRCSFPTRFHCYRTGIGAENLELFEALTRKGGGVFTCFGEADVAAAAKAHRRHCLKVERVSLDGGPAASDVLVAGRRAAVYPGGELVVAAKLKSTGHTRVVVEGTFLGRKVVQQYPVEVTGSGELAPRGWGEMAVASLLALNDPRLDKLAAAYCQEFGIGSRVASFLVLESEADYKRFNLDKERAQTIPGDLARSLEGMWKELGKLLTPREAFERFLTRAGFGHTPERAGPRVRGVDPAVIQKAFDAIQGRSPEAGAQIKRRIADTTQGQWRGAESFDDRYVKQLVALLQDVDFELPEPALPETIIRRSAVSKDYLAVVDQEPGNIAAYLGEADRRAGKDVAGALRALSSVVEMHPGRGDALRLVGYRLLDWKQPARAARLFQQVQRQRPFEPHSYRDLARSLEESGKYGLAAVQYEILLAGTWDQRFGNSLKEVGREEYTHLMHEALRRKAVNKKLADYFGNRLERLATAKSQSDLRVTISWNTDATDVDLWVIEPDGTKCFFQHNRTKSGGELSQDQTQGYGPERYQIRNARPGVYRVVVHYFSPNRNLMAGETHVNVVVTRWAGSPREKVERHTVILKKQGQEVEVCKVKFQ
jgi:hypothetical protein